MRDDDDDFRCWGCETPIGRGGYCWRCRLEAGLPEPDDREEAP